MPQPSDNKTVNLTQLMRMLQLGDSMLPIGSFSFSNGLETAAAEEIVTDTASLEEFTRMSVYQAADCDGLAAIHAHRAARAGHMDGIVEADSAVWERKLNEEGRTMMARMGRKLAELAHRFNPESHLLTSWLEQIKSGKTRGTHPASIAVVLAEFGCDESDTFLVHQYGIASTVLNAALKLVRVDHLDTQRILFDINQTAAEDYFRVRDRSLDDMSNFAPMNDIFASIHVDSHVRLFMN